MFQWDPKKDLQNKKKHGIAFADTFAVLEDPNALTIEDMEHEERRYVTMGVDAFGRVLIVVYSWVGSDIRIISARKASPSEAKKYENKL